MDVSFKTKPLLSSAALLVGIFSGSSAFAADIQISQFLDQPDPAIRGGELTYTISILNGNNDTANDVTLTVPLPATTQFVSVDDVDCSHDGGTPGVVNCGFGDMTGDGLGNPVVTVAIVLRTTAATGNTVSAIASGGTSSPDGNGANDNASQNTTIDDGADLTVTLSDSADPIIAGSGYSYTLQVQNAGPNDANGITVLNTLPAGVTYQSASGPGWSCGNAGQDVTCTRASVGNGAVSPNISIAVRITGAISGNITNLASVSATTRDSDPNNNTGTEDTQVQVGTDLRISKSVAAPVVGNDTTSFTLQPRNLGPFTATNLSVTDTLPGGFTFINVTATGWSCGEALGVITCTRASYGVGATDNIVIQTNVPATGLNVVNDTDIASDTPDPDNSNNSDSITFSVEPDGADLSISKSKSPNPVAQGQNMTSTIRVANNGPRDTAGTVTVTDTLSPFETYVSNSGSNWSCSSNPGEVTCEYLAGAVPLVLANGNQTSQLFIVTEAVVSGNAEDTVSNTACAADVGGKLDHIAGNHCNGASVTSTQAIADLSITKTTSTVGGDDLLEVAENDITYTLTVTNNGPDTLDGNHNDSVVVTDNFPADVYNVVGAAPDDTTVAVAETTGAKFDCVPGSTVRCELKPGETLAMGESSTFQITVGRPFNNGTFTNTAYVSSAKLGDDDSSNNSASDAVTIDRIVDVELQTLTISPAATEAGTNSTHVLTFRNNGPSTATDVEVVHLFAPPPTRSYELISITPSKGSCDPLAGNTLSCDIGSLGRNESRTITLVVRPGWDGANNDWALGNTSTISTSDPESNAANNQQTGDLDVIVADLDLLVNKTDLTDPVGWTPTPAAFPGSLDNIIVYQLEATNRGPSVATGVNLMDQMTPEAGKELKFLCDSDNNASCNVGTSLCNNLGVSVTGPASLAVNCPIADMEVNSSVNRFLFFEVISNPDAIGDAHSNVATITSNEDDNNNLNDSEGETTSARVRVDLDVTKTPSAATVTLFEPFSWNIRVDNNGPGDSADSNIIDNLPAGMELTAAPNPTQGNCTGNAGDTAFTCILGDIDVGNHADITVPVRVVTNPPAGSITNTATATTFGVDSNNGNNSDSDSVDVTVSSLAGIVFNDQNDNGVQEASEHGIAGVTVNVSGNDTYGNAVNTNVVTDADGEYFFDDLAPSNTYQLSAAQAAGFTDGLENADSTIVPNSRATDVFNNVMLAEDTDLENYNFAEVGQAGLNGFVWFDEVSNGTKEVAETQNIAGVTLTVTGNETVSTKAISFTVTTDANGYYELANITAGTYRIVETQPLAWGDGLDALGTAGGTLANDNLSSISLAASQVGANYNFGEQGAALSGKVYRDKNNNGLIEADETGMPNVQLALSGFDLDANAINRTAITNPDGDYVFVGLPASDGSGYTLTELQPSMVTDGLDSAGNLGGSVGNDEISGIIFPANSVGTEYNFGEGPDINARLSGVVFVDEDKNGIQDPGEPGIGGVQLELTGIDGEGEQIKRNVTTDAQGIYSIPALVASSGLGYTITQTQPVVYGDGLDSIDGEIIAGSDKTNVISGLILASSGSITNINFAEVYQASLQGMVFLDVNGNGVMEVSDIGIAGVTLRLTGFTASGGALERSTVTDAGGVYSFIGLPPSGAEGYNLTEQQPAQFQDGLDSNSDGVIVDSKGSDSIGGIEIVVDSALTAYNFAELQSMMVSGVVFEDLNNNGIQETAEPGIAGVIIQLTGTDANANSILLTAVTDGSGLYLFEQVPPSNEQGYQINETQPDGFIDGLESAQGTVFPGSRGSDQIDGVVVTIEGDYGNYNFAETTGQTVTGTVFEDSNNNGIQETGEPGIAGVTLQLQGTDSIGDQVSLTALTDASGHYIFDQVPLSDASGYRILEVQPGDFVDGLESVQGLVLPGSNGSDEISGIVVTADGNYSDYDFAETLGLRISGTVFIDHNDNGIQQDGELGIVGVTVTLIGTDASGNPVSLSVQTDENGQYNFEQVPPSDGQGYRLIEQQPEGFIDGLDSQQGVVLEDSRNSDVIEQVFDSSSGPYDNYNFGELLAGSLAGAVWVDENNNGLIEDSELLRVAGVTISLTGTLEVSSGSEAAQVTLNAVTGAAGNYRFSGLRPGVYQLMQQQPGAWYDGKDSIGSLGGDAANDEFSSINVAAGVDGVDYNFGEMGSNLGGFVYHDGGNDGVKSESDAGIPGVQILLTGMDSDGQVLSRTATTGRDGGYQFRHLPLPSAVGYTLTEVQPEDVNDGQDRVGSLGGILADDQVSQIVFDSHVITGTDYNFGETLQNPASISGMVWLDSNHNRSDDDGNGLADWIVELIDSRDNPKNHIDVMPIAKVTTGPDGRYEFDGLSAGVYEVRFIHPQGGVLYGFPISSEQGTDLSAGTIRLLALSAGEQIFQQNLPIDPSGVVYDSQTRGPVAGATVRFNGPPGFDAGRDLVGGIANVTQLTGSDGYYQFLLFNSAPAGIYTMTVDSVGGYLPGISQQIQVCENTLSVTNQPNPAPIHNADAPPTLTAAMHDPASCPDSTVSVASSDSTTQYYLSFFIDPQLPSGNVINNHIPLDPITNDMLNVVKTTEETNVSRGDLVPYRIVITNQADFSLDGLAVVDALPPGFKYLAGSASVDGVALEPQVNGRQLNWTERSLLPGQSNVIDLITVIGAGVAEGEYVNQAWVSIGVSRQPVSAVAQVSVRLIPDSLMDCSDLSGKVFDDSNANGYQDDDEIGLAAVRLATARGLLVTTDEYGRYHITCAETPNELRGSNFVLKLDERSLPSGFRITTENPRIVRLTRGKVINADFGATLHRVVRIQLTDAAFSGTELKPGHLPALQQSMEALRDKPSVLRLAYSQGNESDVSVENRLEKLKQRIEDNWQDCDCGYELRIEQEVFRENSVLDVLSRTGSAQR